MTHQPDAKLREFTGYRLHHVTHITGARAGETLASFGLRRTTFSALALIVESPGLRQSKLAEALAIEGTNLVKIVDGLEKAGFVRREVDKCDRRAYALKPTARGKRQLDEAMSAVRDQDARLTDGLTMEQIALLHAALDAIEVNAKNSEAKYEFEVSRA